MIPTFPAITPKSLNHRPSADLRLPADVPSASSHSHKWQRNLMADNSTTSLLPSTTDYQIPLVRSSNEHRQSILPSIPKTYTLPRLPQMDQSHHTLMSPPEPTPTDTFAHLHANAMDFKKQSLERAAGNLPLSPPISPEVAGDTAPIKNTDNDPILFPGPTTSSAPQHPLFHDNEVLQQIVKGHIAARDDSIFHSAAVPTQAPQPAEYELTYSFQADVMRQFKQSPMQWFRRERAQLQKDNRQRLKREAELMARAAPQYKYIAPAPTSQSPRVSRTTKAAPRNGVVKSSRQVRTTQKAMADPSKPKAIREDKDYNSIPDYCPPINTLPTNKPNSLKIDWKGQALDLGDDPDMHMLHKDEQLLAANLRLDCATYLTSKRRIFARRLECYRIGKEFRKTDSQQACKIDVNKASKLWEAFRKVGWLDDCHMQRFP